MQGQVEQLGQYLLRVRSVAVTFFFQPPIYFDDSRRMGTHGRSRRFVFTHTHIQLYCRKRTTKVIITISITVGRV
jgi:hypothetical protein